MKGALDSKVTDVVVMVVINILTFAELLLKLSNDIAVIDGTFEKLISGSMVVYINDTGPDVLTKSTSPVNIVKPLSETN